MANISSIGPPTVFALQKIARLFLAFVSLFFSSLSAAQTSYDEELSHLAASVRSLHIRAERARPIDREGQVEIKSELLDISKKLHRLEEEAMTTDLDLQKRGALPDKKLILSARVAKALDLSQSLIDSYLDTHEKAFLTAASQASQTARSLLAQK